MQKALDKFFKGADILMGSFLGLMVFFMLLNVIMRYFFNKSITWSEELSKYLFIWSVYIGAVGAARDNQHIIVRVALDKLPSVPQKVVYVCGQLLSAVTMLLLAYGAYLLCAMSIYRKAEATGIPLYFVEGVGIFMGVGIALVSIANIYRAVVEKIPVQKLLQIHGDPDEMEKCN